MFILELSACFIEEKGMLGSFITSSVISVSEPLLLFSTLIFAKRISDELFV